jgi:hypothetical protein
MKFLKWTAITLGGLLAFSFVFGAIVGPDGAGGTNLTWQAQQRVRDGLRDPGSAQFRNLRVVGQTPYERAVCGEVNAKNAFGAMTGFQGFVALVRSNGERRNITRVLRQEMGGEFAVEWRVHCV